LTLRIHRSSTRDAVVLALSGDIDREHVARLQQFLTSDPGRHLILDLQNVTLVDRAAVQFLAGVETTGIRLVNCPAYVRTWIAAESDSQPQPTPEPDNQE
jgi:anti-anti-sigma regulatory factor